MNKKMKCKFYKKLQDNLSFFLKKTTIYGEFFFTEFCCLSNKKFSNIDNYTFHKIILKSISLCKWRILKIISRIAEKLLLKKIKNAKTGIFLLEFLIFKKKFWFKKNKKIDLPKKNSCINEKNYFFRYLFILFDSVKVKNPKKFLFKFYKNFFDNYNFYEIHIYFDFAFKQCFLIPIKNKKINNCDFKLILKIYEKYFYEKKVLFLNLGIIIVHMLKRKWTKNRILILKMLKNFLNIEKKFQKSISNKKIKIFVKNFKLFKTVKTIGLKRFYRVIIHILLNCITDFSSNIKKEFINLILDIIKKKNFLQTILPCHYRKIFLILFNDNRNFKKEYIEIYFRDKNSLFFDYSFDYFFDIIHKEGNITLVYTFQKFYHLLKIKKGNKNIHKMHNNSSLQSYIVDLKLQLSLKIFVWSIFSNEISHNVIEKMYFNCFLETYEKKNIKKPFLYLNNLLKKNIFDCEKKITLSRQIEKIFFWKKFEDKKFEIKSLISLSINIVRDNLTYLEVILKRIFDLKKCKKIILRSFSVYTEKKEKKNLQQRFFFMLWKDILNSLTFVHQNLFYQVFKIIKFSNFRFFNKIFYFLDTIFIFFVEDIIFKNFEVKSFQIYNFILLISTRYLANFPKYELKIWYKNFEKLVNCLKFLFLFPGKLIFKILEKLELQKKNTKEFFSEVIKKLLLKKFLISLLSEKKLSENFKKILDKIADRSIAKKINLIIIQVKGRFDNKLIKSQIKGGMEKFTEVLLEIYKNSNRDISFFGENILIELFLIDSKSLVNSIFLMNFFGLSGKYQETKIHLLILFSELGFISPIHFQTKIIGSMFFFKEDYFYNSNLFYIFLEWFLKNNFLKISRDLVKLLFISKKNNYKLWVSLKFLIIELLEASGTFNKTYILDFFHVLITQKIIGDNKLKFFFRFFLKNIKKDSGLGIMTKKIFCHIDSAEYVHVKKRIFLFSLLVSSLISNHLIPPKFLDVRNYLVQKNLPLGLLRKLFLFKLHTID